MDTDFRRHFRAILVLGTLWLSGCTSTVAYQHSDGMTKEQATATIDRALMSQPKAHAIEYVEFNADYIGYSEGVVTTGRSRGAAVPVGGAAIAVGRSTSKSRQITNRIYFDSFASAALFKRKSLYIVQVRTTDGLPERNFFTYTEDQGRKLVDAFYSLKRQSSRVAEK